MRKKGRGASGTSVDDDDDETPTPHVAAGLFGINTHERDNDDDCHEFARIAHAQL